MMRFPIPIEKQRCRSNKYFFHIDSEINMNYNPLALNRPGLARQQERQESK